jgi:signal transduction histidine kinase
MKIEQNTRRALVSWLFMGALFVLCGVLGYLQYRWIGEVTLRYGERLRGSLQANLNRLSQDFNSEVAAACQAVTPAEAQGNQALRPGRAAARPEGRLPGVRAAEKEVATRYEQWKKTSRHAQLFSRIAIAESKSGTVVLRSLDLQTAEFATQEWPAAWKTIKERLKLRSTPEPWQNRRPPGPASEGRSAPGLASEDNSLVNTLILELPVFEAPPPGASGAPPGPFGLREAAWLIFDLNLEYVREAILPELVQRHLGAEYQVEVVTRTNPRSVIYQSDPDRKSEIVSGADASVSMFQLQPDRAFRRGGPPVALNRGSGAGPGRDLELWASPGVRDRGPGAGTPRPLTLGVATASGPDLGRWEMFVRHHAGSLEAVVSRTRRRNLAVAGLVLLLLLASVAALIRFTQRAQKFAELQMDFVAGVSHELRTPLTVIHTAAYNLQGKVAGNPGQVEQYGALIQRESWRLKELVEQVLRFAGTKAGGVIREPEPFSVETVIEETMESSKAALQEARCVVEKSVEPGLPLILGDATALKHALQNLLSNAAKYGTDGSNWIGVFASKTGDERQTMVEIRVADRGPGIPADEQRHIFDPFIRGRRAMQNQVHGTGLGLTLVKNIVEAHGGSIRVKSEPTKGTEFIVRIPAAPKGTSITFSAPDGASR